MVIKALQLEQQLHYLERGSRVMSAIHKRAYYSMKEEFRDNG
jgi:hypothetical protein